MNRGLLFRATEPSREPAPGYIIDQVVLCSVESVDVSEDLLQLILRGIRQNYKELDPFVKLKYLRLIRHLVDRGNRCFREMMLKRSAEIKMYTTYTHSTDIYNGDAPAREVRLEADKCLKALYGEEASYQPEYKLYRYEKNEDVTLGPRIEGFGRDSCINGGPLSYDPKIDASDNTGQGYFKKNNFRMNYERSNDAVAMSTLSEAVSSQAETIMTGISQAAATMQKYLPDTIKQKIDQFSTRARAPPSQGRWTREEGYYNSTRNNPYSDNSSNNYSNAGFKYQGSFSGDNFYSNNLHNNFKDSAKRIDLSERFKFTDPELTAKSENPSQSVNSTSISKSHQSMLRSTESIYLNEGLNAEDEFSEAQSMHLTAEAIEIAVATRHALTPSSFIPLGKVAAQYPEEVVVLLLCKINPSLINHPLTGANLVRTATSWHEKLNILRALTAFTDPAVVSDADVRDLLGDSISKFGPPAFDLLRRDVPKCRVLLSRLEEYLGISRSQHSTNLTHDILDDAGESQQIACKDRAIFNLLEEEQEEVPPEVNTAHKPLANDHLFNPQNNSLLPSLLEEFSDGLGDKDKNKRSQLPSLQSSLSSHEVAYDDSLFSGFGEITEESAKSSLQTSSQESLLHRLQTTTTKGAEGQQRQKRQLIGNLDLLDSELNSLSAQPAGSLFAFIKTEL